MVDTQVVEEKGTEIVGEHAKVVDKIEEPQVVSKSVEAVEAVKTSEPETTKITDENNAGITNATSTDKLTKGDKKKKPCLIM
jgi:hypothetical protein